MGANDALVVSVGASVERVHLRRTKLSVNGARLNVDRVGARTVNSDLSNDLNDAVCVTADMDHVADRAACVGGISVVASRRAEGCRADRNRRSLSVNVGRLIPVFRTSLML